MSLFQMHDITEEDLNEMSRIAEKAELDYNARKVVWDSWDEDMFKMDTRKRRDIVLAKVKEEQDPFMGKTIDF